MLDDVLGDSEAAMTKAIESFKRELAKVRTGRANLALLDGVKVEYYGSMTPLNQVATLNVADAKLITVKPWEKPMLGALEKALRASGLGLNPVADSELIRLPIPPLTQERRKELAKLVRKMTEDARISVRAARRDGNDLLKDAEKEKEISEDERKLGQKKIQEITDKYIGIVDEISSNKETEIMEV